MPESHFKSGMGTDVDPVRMILILLTGVLGFESFYHRGTLGAILLLGSIVAAIATGWWMTRAFYLGLVESLEATQNENTAQPTLNT